MTLVPVFFLNYNILSNELKQYKGVGTFQRMQIPGLT